jgi:hypothetical protein
VRLAVPFLAAQALVLTFAGAAASGQVSGLHGVVMRGPTKPVCREGDPCEEPARGILLRFTRAGSVVARVRTSENGTYRVRLRPGTYGVSTLPARRVGTGLTPKIARVPRGRVGRRDFHLDTGLQ